MLVSRGSLLYPDHVIMHLLENGIQETSSRVSGITQGTFNIIPGQYTVDEPLNASACSESFGSSGKSSELKTVSPSGGNVYQSKF